VRVNALFRGVPLAGKPGGGRHRVRLWFDPLAVKLGFGISAVARAANVAALGWSLPRSRRARLDGR
jgi:hypothetical protein